MNTSTDWQGLPYYPISQFYRKQFGEKVYKISVSVAETCPNREGLRGMKTCNFCDVYGSAAYPELRQLPLVEQIVDTRDRMRNLYNAHKYLIYFQAYTNTFTKLQRLRENFEIASQFDYVVGMVVGTRPDCLSEGVFELWNEYLQKKYFVAVELGVQSFDEKQLLWMRRGHTAKKSIEAIQRIAQNSQVDLGIHLMFGLPEETDDDILTAARLCNDLPIHNVKLHNLHVLKNTALEEDYHKGLFRPISRQQYFDRCILFLENLRPDIAVHRLSALTPREEELVAPDWTARKMETYQDLIDYMRGQSAYQGRVFNRF